MKKILFLIHDLGQGGAEKVLINLVNNMDSSKFDITVMTLFDCGENKQFLKSHIKYKTWCKKMIPGNSHLMKLLKPEHLHKIIIKEKYDIEVAYLEGPCARVISGCQDPSVKLVSWIHIEQHTAKKAAVSFRSIQEAKKCYGKFHKIISVSQTVEHDFKEALGVVSNYEVLYNTNETEEIMKLAKDSVTEVNFSDDEIKLVGVGKLLKNKGFDRLIRIVHQLRQEKYPVHLYLLGEGVERVNLEKYITDHQMEDYVTLLGYQLNPYKFVAKCDLFVCSSYAEGFSTAATEALILGIPVCTVDVSGMREMLGENDECGIIVNNEDKALYLGIKSIIGNAEKLQYYTEQAKQRGNVFNKDVTVKAVEEMLLRL